MLKGIVRCLIISSLLVLIISGNCLGQEMKLQLEETLELALKNNLELKIAGVELKNARLAYRKNELQNLLSNSRFLQLQGELALAQAEESYRQARNNQLIFMGGNYLKLIQTGEGIVLRKKEAELEEKKLKEVKAQVKVGYKGELDLFEQQNNYQTALFELERAVDDRKQLMKEFKTELGLKDENNLQLVIPQRPVIWEITEKEAVDMAIKNSTILKLKTKQLELAEYDLARARVSDTPELELQEMENNLKLAELNLKKEEQGLKYEVGKQYYLFKQSVKKLRIMKQNQLQAEENYSIIQEQEKAGLVTKNDLLAAEVNLFKGKNNYLLALNEYYLNQFQLQQVMGLKAEVIIDDRTGK